jgi:transposase
MTTTTHHAECIAPVLLLAFELGDRSWKLGFTTGFGQRPRVRQIPAGAIDRIREEIQRAKRCLRLADATPVMSCYEAGRDGFWLHRWLAGQAITNHVIDSASIEVNRRARRAKTDRLDLAGLLNLLARYQLGDRRVWRVVRVPTVADEDARQLHRSWETLQQDRTRLVCRMQSLLVTQGIRLSITSDFVRRVDAARLWDQTPIAPGLRARLMDLWEQLRVVTAQCRRLAKARVLATTDPTTVTGHCLHRLPTLRGVGPVGSGVLATEIFGWRQIRNARQLGGLVGLVPAPYQSGETRRDTGITRAGNRHVRRVMVQLAWTWLQHQRNSALAQWYRRRFDSSQRLRRIGIVALARKLLVALWRYVEQGVIPEGALLKRVA